MEKKFFVLEIKNHSKSKTSFRIKSCRTTKQTAVFMNRKSEFEDGKSFILVNIGMQTS